MAQVHDLSRSEKDDQGKSSRKMDSTYGLIDGFFDLVSLLFWPFRWLLKTLMFWV
jgi:hypothetical protein